MKHLSALQLCVFLDDALVGAPDEQTARHIASCAMCRGRYEAWCHVDDSLRELLGQLPDEYAMEQRTSWVEIAVAAERKGLPAPEFTELRIPLEQPPTMPGLHMFPPVSLPSPLFAPPPAPARSTPQAAAPPATVVPAPAPRSREVSRPPALNPPPPAPAAQPEVARRAGESGVHPYAAAPTSVAAASPSSPSSSPSSKAESAAADAPAGYARLPRSPRKGIAAFLARPGLWLVLILVAGLVAGVPAGIRRYGIPVLKIDFRDPKQRTSDVRKAEADADGDREPDAATTRPHTGSSRESTTRAKAGKEDPDASILFDLPALEPEDGEPDPATEASPKHTGQAASRVLVSHITTVCGEVRTAQGTPIEGAHVTLSSPPRLVRTDRHGRFCVSCPPGEHTIHIEAPGRAPVTRALKVGRERLETRFTLDAAN